MTQTVKCRMTSCQRRVSPDNRAGVCGEHLHSSKCLCGECHRPERPGTRKVQVNTGNPGSSWGAPITASVTLPAMPWGDE